MGECMAINCSFNTIKFFENQCLNLYIRWIVSGTIIIIFIQKSPTIVLRTGLEGMWNIWSIFFIHCFYDLCEASLCQFNLVKKKALKFFCPWIVPVWCLLDLQSLGPLTKLKKRWTMKAQRKQTLQFTNLWFVLFNNSRMELCYCPHICIIICCYYITKG